MTRRVIFKPAAVAEMVQAHAWYEQREAGLGDELNPMIFADYRP
jgi:hypothetical protein